MPVKNLMVRIDGYSPYVALFGRSTPLLAEFEPASECQIDDSGAGLPGISRHHHRLRELAVESMIELTARKRLRRAAKSKIRVVAEQLELASGDLVDFSRAPATKDESGWHGPATVVEMGPPHVLRWQGRMVQVRTQDLRRALVCAVFLTLLAGSEPCGDAPVQLLMSYADGLQAKVVRLGWIASRGWHRAAANSQRMEVLLAAHEKIYLLEIILIFGYSITAIKIY